MSVYNTVRMLQKLHASVPGVKTTPERFPGSIPTADMPMTIVIPGIGRTTKQTARGLVSRTERLYSVRLFVDALGQSDYSEPTYQSIDFIVKFLDLYMTNTTLEDGYTEIVRIEDSGVISGGDFQAVTGMNYAGNWYKGVVFTLTILELYGE